MRLLTKLIVQGLAALLPIALTIYVIRWLAVTGEEWLGGLLREILPEGAYKTGMGVGLGLLVVIAVGILCNALIVRRVLHLIDRISAKITLVKTIYGSVNDLMSYFSQGGAKNKKLSKPVLVTVAPGIDTLGVLTRDAVPELGRPDLTAVYIPMSYGIGGLTVLVPSAALKPVDMSIEEALRFAVTAGMTADKLSTSTSASA